MSKIADEQIKQLFAYKDRLENALKTIRREAKAIDDDIIVHLVDEALSYGEEEN